MIGLVAGATGSLAMNLFARAVDGDRAGHGVQPPQSDARGEDATVRAGSAVFTAVSGQEPASTARAPLGIAAHYAFGAAVGVLYVLMGPRVSWLRRGRGALYGALVWAIADEGLMPALGLSRGPLQLDRQTHAYALAGHVIYGVAVHGVVTGSNVRPSRH